MKGFCFRAYLDREHEPSYNCATSTFPQSLQVSNTRVPASFTARTGFITFCMPRSPSKPISQIMTGLFVNPFELYSLLSSLICPTCLHVELCTSTVFAMVKKSSEDGLKYTQVNPIRTVTTLNNAVAKTDP